MSVNTIDPSDKPTRRRATVRSSAYFYITELSQDPDFEYALIDGTVVKVHRHGSGAKGGLKIRPSANRAAG